MPMSPQHGLAAAFICLLLTFGQAQGQTPPSDSEATLYRGLHAAAWHSDVAAVARLRGAGAEIDARDNNGRTPYLIAAYRGDQALMRALVEAGADPRAKDHQNYDAITILAVKDNAEAMSLAISLGGDPKAVTSPYLGTALIAASHLGHDEVVRRLIRAGAPLDHVNNLGWTALIEAVILGQGGSRHIATVTALVRAGARRDLTDRDGVIPLHHAQRRGYAAMVKILEAP